MNTNKQNPKRKTSHIDEFTEQAQRTILQGVIILVKQLLAHIVRKADPDFDENLANRGRNGR